MGIFRTYRPSGPAIWTRDGGWQSPTPASQLPIFHPGNPMHSVVFGEREEDETQNEDSPKHVTPGEEG